MLELTQHFRKVRGILRKQRIGTVCASAHFQPFGCKPVYISLKSAHQSKPEVGGVSCAPSTRTDFPITTDLEGCVVPITPSSLRWVHSVGRDGQDSPVWVATCAGRQTKLKRQLLLGEKP